MGGWATATDDEGSTYYWNKETKETTWQKPGTAPTKDSAGNVYDDESEQDDGPDFSSWSSSASGSSSWPARSLPACSDDRSWLCHIVCACVYVCVCVPRRFRVGRC